jgi:hypothetical protein
VIAVGSLAGCPDIQPWSVDRIAFEEIVVPYLQGLQTGPHIQKLLNLLIIDQKHCSTSEVSLIIILRIRKAAIGLSSFNTLI